MGDYHARFCERFGVKAPLPTRPPATVKIVHIDVFQAADIKTIDPNSNRIITIDYQLTDDWVIQNPMWSKPGDVQGADYKLREEGGESWKTNHTSPMWKQGRQFWEKLDTKILKLSPQDIVPDDKTKA